MAATLVIHTKKNGEISEAASGQERRGTATPASQSREIDLVREPNKAIVSVMMLREGWDVQNVTVIVGFRAYSSKANILPEQTLGRGLRRMFRDADVQEKVSVVGTPAFMEFVESIRTEGVELEVRPMGERAPAFGPMVVEVDPAKSKSDIEKLDIELPVMRPRLEREYKNIGADRPADHACPHLFAEDFHRGGAARRSFSSRLTMNRSATSLASTAMSRRRRRA